MTDSPPEVGDSSADEASPLPAICQINFATKLAYGAGDVGRRLRRFCSYPIYRRFSPMSHIYPQDWRDKAN